MVLPLEPTEVPGVYRRGSRFVAVYRAAGRQHKQSAATLGEALQRWMGHHSPAFTFDTYGRLIDADLGPPLDLRRELANPPGQPA